MVVIVDDEDRENEGDVTIAAEFCTAEHITFMATHARGLICQTMTPEQCERLGLELMVPRNGSQYETAFTVSIEAAEGVTTGISAADRAHTIRVAANPNATRTDIIQPGHVFPLRAKPKGVLERTGQTEGSVDMCKLSGLTPSAVICEIMNDDGTMARVPDLANFCETHGIKMITISDMIDYRRRTEKLVNNTVTVDLPTDFGDFVAHGYTSELDGHEHIALVKGDLGDGENVLVRVHSECRTGDVFGSHRCDCASQLHRALEEIEREGRGVLLYMEQEGRGIGLLNKLRSYELQQNGMDTVEANLQLGFAADQREYDMAAQILRDLGVRSVRLMTNNPRKVDGLERMEVRVSERLSIEAEPKDSNRHYLKTKRDKLGHLLEHTGLNERTLAAAER